MPNLIGNTVVLHPKTGEPVLLAGGGPLPDWATDLVGAHLLDGPKGSSPSASPTPAPGESREQKRARLLAQLAELGDDDGSDESAQAPTGSPEGGPEGGQDGPPPKGGAGSGAPAWREYAASNEVEVPADASREDVIAALDAAGVRTE
ncbi:hypothetical protein [Micromonospora aurantiaca]|uniref:Uncharacterized protein n=1 Tax=Micromonospora aurantiaca (nom. illeg.) TaxID=47850 RepID=A0A6N3JVL2_9ACTN|nr:hypothetical protein [Micromonospora aurantiaca]AXH89412.1 hypothetical protein DVH21_05370 [Micromonospora aurantiaca]